MIFSVFPFPSSSCRQGAILQNLRLELWETFQSFAKRGPTCSNNKRKVNLNKIRANDSWECIVDG